MRIAVIVVNLLALTPGCTNFKTVNDQSTAIAISELALGDTVQVVTADARKFRFKIEAIEDDALVGKDVRVSIEDIRLVSIERVDPVETAVAGVGTVGLVLLVLLIAASPVFFAL
jgi:hypothetical protein